jgi:hypothetical protein
MSHDALIQHRKNASAECRVRLAGTASYVPYQSLNQGHAAFMPNTRWAVSRHPPTFVGGRNQGPGFDAEGVRHQRFTHVRLLDSHLTEFDSAFSNNAYHGSI